MPPTPPCPLCKGRLHVFEQGRWRRCNCIAITAQNSYIHPALRMGETAYPAASTPLVPLQSAAFTGSFDAFRHLAWRSLDALRPVPYVFLTTAQVCTIHFEKDDLYPSLQALRETPPLVILAMGLGDIPNSWNALLAYSLVMSRQLHHVPTWLYLKSFVDIGGYEKSGKDLCAWARAHLVLGEPDERRTVPGSAPVSAGATPATPASPKADPYGMGF